MLTDDGKREAPRNFSSVLRSFLCLSTKVRGAETHGSVTQPGLFGQEDGRSQYRHDQDASDVASRYPSWIGWLPDMDTASCKAADSQQLQHMTCKLPDPPRNGPDNHPLHGGRSASLRSDPNATDRTLSEAPDDSSPECGTQLHLGYKDVSPCVATSQLSIASGTSGSDIAALYGFQVAPWEHHSAHSFSNLEGLNNAAVGSAFRQQSGFDINTGSLADLSNLSQRSTTSSNGSSRTSLQPGLLSAKFRQSACDASRASLGSRDLWSNQRRHGKYASLQQLQQRRWWQQFQQPTQQLQVQLGQPQQQQARLPVTIDEDRSLRGVRDYLDGCGTDPSTVNPPPPPAAEVMPPISEAPVVPYIQTYGFCTGVQATISPGGGYNPAPLLLPEPVLCKQPLLSPHLTSFDGPKVRHLRHMHTSDVIHKLPLSGTMSAIAMPPNGKVSVGSTLETSMHTMNM